VFTDECAVSQQPDIDPADVFDRPPPHHRFVGRWPNVCCVPICNAEGTDNLFGLNREHYITKNPLRFTNQPMTDDWQLSQVKGRSDGRGLHDARRSHDDRRRRDEQKQVEKEYHQRWGFGTRNGSGEVRSWTV